MKLLIIFFCAVAITTASIERQKILDLLDGKTVTLSSFEVKHQVGSLPDPYQPLTSEDQTAASKAKDFVEMLREYFPKGYQNIPPLDPYQPVLDPIPIKMLNLISGELVLSEVKATGAQKFKLGDLGLRLKYDDKLIRGDGAVSLPSLQVAANFNLSVKAASIPVSLTGKFTATISDITAKAEGGTYLTKLNGEDRDQINAVEAEALAGQVEVKVLFDDPEAAQLLKAAVPCQSKIDEMQKDIEESALNVAIKEINKVLAAYTDEEIRASLK